MIRLRLNLRPKNTCANPILQRNGELLFWERKEKRGIESIDKSNNNLLGRKFLSLMLRRGGGLRGIMEDAY